MFQHAHALQLLSDHLLEGTRALDVGSGSGYLTACMALMVNAHLDNYHASLRTVYPRTQPILIVLADCPHTQPDLIVLAYCRHIQHMHIVLPYITVRIHILNLSC